MTEGKLLEININEPDLKKYENAIVILSDGKAYLKQLPAYGVTEIHTKKGKVVKGDDRLSWIIS